MTAQKWDWLAPAGTGLKKTDTDKWDWLAPPGTGLEPQRQPAPKPQVPTAAPQKTAIDVITAMAKASPTATLERKEAALAPKIPAPRPPAVLGTQKAPTSLPTFPTVKGAQLDQGKLSFEPAGKPSDLLAGAVRAVLGEKPYDERWASIPSTPVQLPEVEKLGLQMSTFTDPKYGITYLEVRGIPHNRNIVSIIPGQWDNTRQAWVALVGEKQYYKSPAAAAKSLVSSVERFEKKTEGMQNIIGLIERGHRFGAEALTFDPSMSKFAPVPAETTAEKVAEWIGGTAGRAFVPLPLPGAPTLYGAFGGTAGQEAALRAMPKISKVAVAGSPYLAKAVNALPVSSSAIYPNVAARIIEASLTQGVSSAATLGTLRGVTELLQTPVHPDEWDQIPDHFKKAAGGVVTDVLAGFIVGSLIGGGLQGVREVRYAREMKTWQDVGRDVFGEPGAGVYRKQLPPKAEDIKLGMKIKAPDGRVGEVLQIRGDTVRLQFPPDKTGALPSISSVKINNLPKQWVYRAESLTPENHGVRVRISAKLASGEAKPVEGIGEVMFPRDTTSVTATGPPQMKVPRELRLEGDKLVPRQAEPQQLPAARTGKQILAGEQVPPAQAIKGGPMKPLPGLKVVGGELAPPAVRGTLPHGKESILRPSQFRGGAAPYQGWTDVLAADQAAGVNVAPLVKSWLVENDMGIVARSGAESALKGIDVATATVGAVIDAFKRGSAEHQQLAIAAQSVLDTEPAHATERPISAPGEAQVPEKQIPLQEGVQQEITPKASQIEAEKPAEVAKKEPWEMDADEWYNYKFGKLPQKARTAILNREKGVVSIDEIRQQTDSEHRRMIAEALSEGKPVPESVLKDYSDLAKQPQKEVAAPPVTDRWATDLAALDKEVVERRDDIIRWARNQAIVDRAPVPTPEKAIDEHYGTYVRRLGSAAGTPLKKGETWRGRLVEMAEREAAKAAKPAEVAQKEVAAPKQEIARPDKGDTVTWLDAEGNEQAGVVRLHDEPDTKVTSILGADGNVHSVAINKLTSVKKEGPAAKSPADMSHEEYMDAISVPDVPTVIRPAMVNSNDPTKWHLVDDRGIIQDVMRGSMSWEEAVIAAKEENISRHEQAEARKKLTARISGEAPAAPVTQEKPATSVAENWDAMTREERTTFAKTFGWGTQRSESMAKSTWANISPAARKVMEDGKPLTGEEPVGLAPTAQATLADYDMKLVKTTTKGGAPVWNLSGETKKHSRLLGKSGAGGTWYGPKRVWSFYGDEDPTEKILAALPKTDVIPKAEDVAKPEKIVDTGIKEDTPTKEVVSDADEVSTSPARGRSGAETLEGVQTEDVPGAPESRPAGESGIRGPAADGGHDVDATVSGVDSARGVEYGETGMDIPAGREDRPGPGERPGDVGAPTGRRGRRGVTGQNYRITQEEGIDTRSKLQKTKDNIAVIRLMKELVAERSPATAEEQEVLVKYSGWGFNPQIFDTSNKEFADFREELESLLTSEEHYAARQSTQYAHYTPPGVINAMYEALSHMGFRGGNVLEPAMGAGHFFGMMPEEMAKASRISGVEIDSITGNIAKLLYPRGDISVMGYQDFDVPYDKTKLRRENHFDLIISNVPFSNTKGFHDMRYAGAPGEASLHNYFFIKALDHLRPGGIMAFITSHYTMDAQDSKFRKYIAENADLLGAVRMHNESMKGTAETAVTADIIFLQKREPGAEAKGAQWIKAEKQPGFKGLEGKSDWERSYYAPAVNEYFIENPRMVMGEQEVKQHGMYGQYEYTVNPTPETKDLYEAIGKVVKTLPNNVYAPPPKHEATEAATVDVLAPAPADAVPFSFLIKDGKVVSVQVSDAGELVLMPAAEIVKGYAKDGVVDKRIRGMIGLRDALTDLIRKELNDDPGIEAARKKLNTLYDAFVKKYELVNDRKNHQAFSLDPGYFRTAGLEHWNKDKKKYEKAAIFRQRTIRKYEPATKADTPKEALMLSLNERGRVDLEHVSGLVGMGPVDVVKELSGLIFHDPQKGWVMEDEYLSGNVREKLRIAQESAKHEPERYKGNVEALQAVQPKDLEPHEIISNLGAPWIPAPVVHQFIAGLLQIRSDYLKVAFSPVTGVWDVQVHEKGKGPLSYSAKNTMEYGTPDMPAIKIIQNTLNSLEVVVNKTIEHPLDPEKTKRVPDQNATLAAKNKQKAILGAFKEWLWADEKRSEYLTSKYNDEYNNLRLREFNGTHLTLPGTNPSTTLRPHQKRAVWRIVQGNPTLLHHWVGAGKTMEMVAGAMELKRLGIVKKPMMVAPNFLVGSHAEEAGSLYPGAKILTFTEADLEAKNRKRLTAKIATGDWDLVVMPSSTYGLLPMSADYVERWIDGELLNLRRSIERAKMEGVDKKSVKQIENAVDRMQGKLETYLKSIQKRQDQGHLSFEELGVDALFVDEAHLFKNLFFATRMSRVGSLGNPEGVQKAFDMLMKVDYIRSLRGGSGVVFASGTPISNSLTETYIMQRYLAPEQLAEKGITTFDSWAKSFGEVVSARELSPSGKGFRMKQRFAKIVNVPELITMYRQFADVLNRDQLEKILADVGITLPRMKTGKRQTMAAEVTPEITAYIDYLDERGEAIRAGMVDPAKDNFLKIVHEGRLVALYPPLVGLPDYHGSRVHMATKNIFDSWRRTKDSRMTQLVFLDLSVPKGRTRAQELAEVVADDDVEAVADESSEAMVATVYGVVRKKLISLGVPAGEIAFIHDYKDAKSRERLFEEMNSGEKRILLGSTSKMGVGMNVQQRVTALHHIDCPWKPAELTQREGRALRQGNMNEEVDVYTYVTKRTLDPFMWQTLERKQAIISRIESGDLSMRTMEDIDEDASQFGNIKAIATDNPLMLEYQEIGDRILELSIEQHTFERDRLRAQKEIREHKKEIEKEEGYISNAKKDLATRQDTRGDKFKAVIAGKTYTKREEAGEKLSGLITYANKVWMENEDVTKASKAFEKKYGALFQVELYESKWGKETSTYVKAGSFAGFDIRVDFRYHAVSLSGENAYPCGSAETATGSIQVMANAAESIEKQIKGAQARIAESREEVAMFEKLLEKKSDVADDLEKLYARKAEIEQEMDMDKNRMDAGGDHEEAFLSESIFKNRVDKILAGRIEDSEQAFTSRHTPEKTAIKQVASGLRRGVAANVLKEGTVNLDMGGGRFDEGTKFLADKGVTNLVYDPYAREKAHNDRVIAHLESRGGADTATLNNVLNVIEKPDKRRDVIRFLYESLCPGGSAIVTVYEGSGTGKGRRLEFKDGTSTWQENRKTATYEKEIQAALPKEAQLSRIHGMYVIQKLDEAAAGREKLRKAPRKTERETTIPKELPFAVPKATAPKKPVIPAPATGRAEIVSKQAIIKKISDYFHVPVRIGRFHGAQKAAIYKVAPEVIRTKVKNARSLRILTHELGHHLDKLLKMVNKDFEYELLRVPYVKELRAEYPNMPVAKLMKEGVAEYIRYYLTDPEPIGKYLPEFHDYFEKKLLDHPDVQDKLLDIRALIDVYTKQSNVEAHLDEFIGGERPKHGKFSTANAKDQAATWWERFSPSKIYTALIDRDHPIFEATEKIVGDREKEEFKNIWDVYRTSASDGRAELFIEHGQYKEAVDKEGNPTGEIEKVAPALVEIWGKVSAQGKTRAESQAHIDRFNKYIVSKHAIEVEQKGMVSGALDADRGIDLEHLEAFVKNVERSDYGALYKKQLDEVVNYRNFIFDMLVAKDEDGHGHYSEEDRDQILGKWKYPIPFKRILPEERAKSRSVSSASPVKRFKGADLPIVPPIQSLMRETMLYNKLALENEAAITFFDLLKTHPAEAGNFMDKIPLPKMVTKTSLREIIENITSKGMEPDFDIEGLESLSIELYRPMKFTQVGKNIAVFWRGGSPEAYEIYDKELFGAVTKISSEQSVMAGKIGRMLSAPFRLGHIVNTAFPWRNMHRDTPLAAAHSEYGFIPYASFFDGILSIIAGPAEKAFAKFTKQHDLDEKNFAAKFLLQQDEYKEMWMYYGGTMRAPDVFNDRAAEKMLQRAMQREMSSIVWEWINPLKYLKGVAASSEMGTNIGETKKAFAKGVVGRRAVAAGRDLTVDHNVFGSKTKFLRDVIPFFNPFFQGNAKLYRQLKNPRTRWRTLMKYAMFITLPTIVCYLLIRENKYYQEMSPIRKDLFFHIPVGNPKTTPYFLPIPRAHSITGFVFGAMAERAIAYVDKHDKAAFKDWAESLRGSLTPNMTIWPVELAYELNTNFNLFGGYPIENMSDVKKPKAERYGAYTSETAKALGQLFDISPKKVDFSVSKVTGILGRTAVSGIDAVLELTGLTDGTPKAKKDIASKTIIGDYFTRVRASGSVSIDRLYEDRDKLDMIINSERTSEEKQAVAKVVRSEVRKIENSLSDLRAMERDVHKAKTWGDIEAFAPEGVKLTSPVTPEKKQIALDFLQLTQINLVRMFYGKEPIVW